MDLLKKAKQTIFENARIEELSTAELRRLLAEIQIERIELLQENERLRADCHQLIEFRDRFEDLYDYAPFAYVCIDESGTITSANLTTASILKSNRQQLIGKRLALFIKEDNRQIFYDIRQELMNTNRPQACNLSMCQSDRSEISVQMVLELIEKHEEPRHEIRIAILQSTEAKYTHPELEVSRNRLLNLYRHMQSLREQEKYTFSRAIHDELSQVLAVLKMELSWLEEDFDPQSRRVRQQFESLNNLLDHTIRASKHITSELRPYMLDELGLASAIKWSAQKFRNRSGIQVDLDFAAAPAEIDKNRATAAFRIFQELLANVERHSGASRVTIAMRSKNQCLVLEVRDNGCGISSDHVSGASSFGLMDIRERAHEFGGDLTITGVPDEGTRAIVQIPMPSRQSPFQNGSMKMGPS